MTLLLETPQDLCQHILQTVQRPRADAFVPADARPDPRFGRFMPDGTPRISPSQVNTLRMCPARWKHQYLDGMPDPGSYQAVVGSIGHAAMEAALETTADPVGPRALAEATRVAAQVHLSTPATLAGTMNGHQADAFALADRVADAVKGAWEWLLHHDVEVLGVEEKVVGQYHNDIDVASLSFVDARLRIDGRERVIDWKFPGRAPWTVNGQVAARDSYQLAMQMYGDAYQQAGVAVDEAWIVHAPLDGNPVAVAKQDVSMNSIAASRVQVHDAIGQILRGDLQPDPVTPGPLCSTTWCPFFAQCPAT